MRRYLRLIRAFARFTLLNELAFRINFLVKISVEVIWLGLILIFYDTVFSKTTTIEGWSHPEFLIFLGIYYALAGIIETFFLENCNEFADLVRKGDLDIYLLKPIDEQFLITCRKIDWSTAPNILLGGGIIGWGLFQLPDWRFDLGWTLLFFTVFLCGVVMAYSFLVMLMATGVWLVRNQSLMELWWLFTTLMRYPVDIYVGKFASPLGIFFSFVVPILLIVYVPARTLLHRVDGQYWQYMAVMLAATAGLLLLSRTFFRRALQSYRSASS